MKKRIDLFETLADMTRPEPKKTEGPSEEEMHQGFNEAYEHATRHRGLIHKGKEYKNKKTKK